MSCRSQPWINALDTRTTNKMNAQDWLKELYQAETAYNQEQAMLAVIQRIMDTSYATGKADGYMEGLEEGRSVI